MTAVLLLGDAPHVDLFTPPGRLRRAPVPVTPLDVAALVRQVRDELAQAPAVLVLHAAWGGDAAARTVGLLRRALGTGRVVGVPLDLPPAALSVAAAAVAAAGADVSRPGALLDGVPRVVATLGIGAWSSRPHGGGPRSRLAGLAPWTRFLVTIPRAPQEAAVDPVPVTATRPTVRPWTAVDGAVVVLAGPGRDLEPARRAALPALQRTPLTGGAPGTVAAGPWAPPLPPTRVRVQVEAPVHLVATPATRRAAHPWRARRLVEVITCPTSTDVLAEAAAAGFTGVPCPWCGEAVAALPCPFCHAAPTPADAGVRPPAASRSLP